MWEDRAEHVFVMCSYAENVMPFDCYTRIGQDEDGMYWFDEGDDQTRYEYGPFPTRKDAVAAAQAYAAENDEGVGGEDADQMKERLLRQTAGEPDNEGEYCVWWSTVGDDSHVVGRYATAEQAMAAGELADRDLRERYPGTLLCGFEVRRLDDGQWVEFARDGREYG